ncbi:F-box protein At2g39490 isoform X2 [Sesamum indicum]|uniref:F-box protein At2g39490 isoform X2 n=1 Tax=Sesamum indicum TaxID=4182 RepID=A0A6I9UAI2_SESIN|nr:F-box protein At2g39490 isoform X2 [Sesamum indicum]
MSSSVCGSSSREDAVLMGERPDLISSLPDDILKNIMSMISFKEAIQITTLSTSWRGLVSPHRVTVECNIVRSDALESKRKLKPIIESFLGSRESFRSLKLYPDLCDRDFAVCTRGAHGELHLDFSGHKELVPCTFGMVLDHSSCAGPRFSSVRNLHLRSVSHLVGNLVGDLFSSCRILETLKLEKCRGLENLDIKSNSFLKNLEIADCPNIATITISAENLKSFSYKGALPIIQLINIPHLVDVALNLGDGLGNKSFDCEEVLSLLSSVKDVEILTVSGWLIEVLCSAGVIFSALDFKFSKLKEFRCVCSKISSKTRDSLACFLNTTTSLEELFVKDGGVSIEQPVLARASFVEGLCYCEEQCSVAERLENGQDCRFHRGK